MAVSYQKIKTIRPHKAGAAGGEEQSSSRSGFFQQGGKISGFQIRFLDKKRRPKTKLSHQFSKAWLGSLFFFLRVAAAGRNEKKSRIGLEKKKERKKKEKRKEVILI
ncbi:hypothetical protein SLEP1_g55184 [Rubroshorea leprosula]|uniref:Uncharacterized protein n=1 Tax=Rubroshorea leprosula TaxID=152421 RepID=A0AAV5MFQ2_9ROSI|nr:hypothetical protein SLEP1_g55184 [Rubroshorea leprosula]